MNLINKKKSLSKLLDKFFINLSDKLRAQNIQTLDTEIYKNNYWHSFNNDEKDFILLHEKPLNQLNDICNIDLNKDFDKFNNNSEEIDQKISENIYIMY